MLKFCKDCEEFKKMQGIEKLNKTVMTASFAKL